MIAMSKALTITEEARMGGHARAAKLDKKSFGVSDRSGTCAGP
jgi:hypothetical protein